MNTIDGVPELPFEQILGYLSLEDVIKARAVSRIWKIRIDNFRAKTLCLANCPSNFIPGKSRVVDGAFAQNFISSRRFATFLGTFGQSILSNLNYLHLLECRESSILQALNSFSQLKELDIIEFGHWPNMRIDCRLNLSMLTSIRLKSVKKVQRLILDAPKLKSVKFWQCPPYLRLDIVHGESVEKLVTDSSKLVTELKHLKSLYIKCDRASHSTFPLNQLKEVHLICSNDEHTRQLFDQMRTCQHADLKIYLHGLLLNGLLNGPDDPAISSSFAEAFVQLAESPWRLADEIPFIEDLHYTTIKPLVRLSAINVLKSFTDLKRIIVDDCVFDTKRFLDFLKNLEHISELTFTSDQLQELFDELPEHCAVLKLELELMRLPSDVWFLFRLKSLISLRVRKSIMDAQTVGKLFENLPFLTEVEFTNNEGSIRHVSKRFFTVSLPRKEYFGHHDLNATIQFLSNHIGEDRGMAKSIRR